jgi:hypothetical protein
MTALSGLIDEKALAIVLKRPFAAQVSDGDIRELIEAYEAAKKAPVEERVHDAIRYGLNVCPCCSSGDVRWCNISVRPYCNECKHWGRAHFGTAEEAIKRWNSQ